MADLATPLDRSLPTSDDIAQIDEQAAGAALRGIVECCLARLDPPELVRTIIERVHGLRGCRRTSQRDLGLALGIPCDVVADATRWFAEAMAQPGGVFFSAVTALDPLDREALGLSWVAAELAGPSCAPLEVPRRLVDAGVLARRRQPAG